MGLYPVAMCYNARQDSTVQYNTAEHTIQYIRAHNTIQQSTQYNTAQHTIQYSRAHNTIQQSTQYNTAEHTIQYSRSRNTIQQITQYNTAKHTIQYNRAHNTIQYHTSHNIQHSRQTPIFKITNKIQNTYTIKTQKRVEPKVDESALKTTRYTKQSLNHSIQHSITDTSQRPTPHSISLLLDILHIPPCLFPFPSPILLFFAPFQIPFTSLHFTSFNTFLPFCPYTLHFSHFKFP